MISALNLVYFLSLATNLKVFQNYILCISSKNGLFKLLDIHSFYRSNSSKFKP